MSSVSARVSPASAGYGSVVPATDVMLASVVFGDRPMLEVNRLFVAQLNPGRTVRWRIVRNRPPQASDQGGEDDPDVEVLDGRELPFELRLLKKFRSYHHALALNVASREVPTRYLILIDPDCYIVRANWIEDVLSHVSEHGLAFFGTPYHPRSIAKFRYFPNSVFLVVDTEVVPTSTLDWYPEAGTPPGPGLMRRALETPFRLAGWRLRLRHEESEDTGIRVYSHYRDAGASVECVQPVMIPEYLSSFMRPKQRVLEKVMPDRYCVIPKRRGYFTDRGFASFGFEDAARMLNAEEYMWRDEPFALHLRGAPESLRNDPDGVARLLAQFA
jgi:hypothetical protein